MKLKSYLLGLATGIVTATLILAIADTDDKPLSDAQIRQRAAQLGMVEGDSLKLSALQNNQPKDGGNVSPAGADNPAGGVKPAEIPESSANMPESAAVPDSSAENTESAVDLTNGSAEKEEGISGETISDGTISGGTITDGTITDGTITGGTISDGTVETTDVQNGLSAETKAAEDNANAGPSSSFTTNSDNSITLVIIGGASSNTVSQQLAAAGLVENARAYDLYLCNNGFSQRIHPGTYHILPGTSGEEIAKMIAY